MSNCPHDSFSADVSIQPLSNEDGGPVASLAISLRAWCSVCGEPVRFEGPIGAAVGRGAPPMVSIGGLELNAAGHMGNNDTPLMGFRVKGGLT